MAAEGDLVVRDDGAGREGPAGQLETAGRGARDIGDGAALLAEEMGVGLEVGAIAGGLTVVIDGADEAALGEGLEAIIYGGQGDAGELLLDSQEDIHRGGMIVLEERVVDLAALGGETEPLLGDRLVAALAAGVDVGFR